MAKYFMLFEQNLLKGMTHIEIDLFVNKIENEICFFVFQIFYL